MSNTAHVRIAVDIFPLRILFSAGVAKLYSTLVFASATKSPVSSWKACLASSYSFERLVQNTPLSSVHSMTGWPADIRNCYCQAQRVQPKETCNVAMCAPAEYSSEKWWSARLITLSVITFEVRHSSTGIPATSSTDDCQRYGIDGCYAIAVMAPT